MLVSRFVLGIRFVLGLAPWKATAMKNYYVLSNGRVKREANTLYIENEAGQKKPVPVEDVESLYLYGEVDINTKLLVFLAQKKITLHVFNYYGFYSGSYYPREYLHSGYLLVHQVSHYGDAERRLTLARELVRGARNPQLNRTKTAGFPPTRIPKPPWMPGCLPTSSRTPSRTKTLIRWLEPSPGTKRPTRSAPCAM
jgi:hypothetical protein